MKRWCDERKKNQSPFVVGSCARNPRTRARRGEERQTQTAYNQQKKKTAEHETSQPSGKKRLVTFNKMTENKKAPHHSEKRHHFPLPSKDLPSYPGVRVRLLMPLLRVSLFFSLFACCRSTWTTANHNTRQKKT